MLGDITQGHLSIISAIDLAILICIRDIFLVSMSCGSEERRLLKTIPKKENFPEAWQILILW